jgi:hypothetical protein
MAGVHEHFQAAGGPTPWQTRSTRAAFRGSCTGNVPEVQEFSIKNRLRIAEMGLRHPEFLEIVLGGGTCRVNRTYVENLSYTPEMEKVMKDSLGTNPNPSRLPFSEEDYGRYKYVLDIEGDGCPTGRASKLLLSGAVNLKYNGNGNAYYTSSLIPWIHYVPIKTDLSDLLSTLAWLRANDEVAEKIGAAGRAFALANFSRLGLDCYLADYITNLAKLQTVQDRSSKILQESEDISWLLKTKLPIVREMTSKKKRIKVTCLNSSLS